MPRFIPWALCAVLCVVIAVQTWLLDSRVQAMQGRLTRLQGATQASPVDPAPPPQPQAVTGAAGGLAAADAGAPQLAMLDELQRMREDLASLRLAMAATPDLDELDRASDDARILEVVQRRNQRVLEKQLDFHRTGWLEMRQRAAQDFGRRMGLDPDQIFGLKRAAALEVDAMVKLLARPGVLANPKLAEDDWRAALAATDEAAEAMLDEEQLAAWRAGREQERAALWTWLELPHPGPALK